MLEDHREHRRRGRLAVRAGDTEHVTSREHVLGQPLRTRHERQPAVQDCFHQRVAARDDVADDPQIRGDRQLVARITLDQAHAGRLELFAHRRVHVGIATGDAMTSGQRELRQATHEGAADAEDVDVHEVSNAAAGGSESQPTQRRAIVMRRGRAPGR